MKSHALFRVVVQCFLLVGSITTTESFSVTSEHKCSSLQSTFAVGLPQERPASATSGNRGTVLFSSTSTRPLYDGTNMTFPDTRTPAGVAELLEVSFIHGCMQLASGYVDVLKMFIAASIGAYEAGFSVASILEELENNKDMPNTANRPLMDEEKMLRRDWFCVVYLSLAAMGHTSKASPLAADVAKNSIPEDIQQRYGELVTRVGEAYQKGGPSLSVEDLTNGFNDEGLSPLEKAVLLQSLKVATLTPTVVEESKDARGDTNTKKEVKPPTPPIEGAF